MFGAEPPAIITDQAQSICNAVETEFPNALTGGACGTLCVS
jgi:hypothetical protein